MYGGRVSLTLAFLVVFLETLLGVIFGGLAGFFGGWVDMVIMRVVDVFICLPGMPILLISSQLIKAIPSISADARIYWLMGILTVFGWSGHGASGARTDSLSARAGIYDRRRGDGHLLVQQDFPAPDSERDAAAHRLD